MSANELYPAELGMLSPVVISNGLDKDIPTIAIGHQPSAKPKSPAGSVYGRIKDENLLDVRSRARLEFGLTQGYKAIVIEKKFFFIR